jgi:hypothetical protein
MKRAAILLNLSFLLAASACDARDRAAGGSQRNRTGKKGPVRDLAKEGSR